METIKRNYGNSGTGNTISESKNSQSSENTEFGKERERQRGREDMNVKIVEGNVSNVYNRETNLKKNIQANICNCVSIRRGERKENNNT